MSRARREDSQAIQGITYPQNIGRFESVRGSRETGFAPLTLVYSANGRGKTTLCAILRPLASGDARRVLRFTSLDGRLVGPAVQSASDAAGSDALGGAGR